MSPAAGEKEIPISVLMQYFRVPVPPLSVDYHGRELLLESRITNISAHGVFIKTKRPLPLDTEVEISFNLPREATVIRGVGVVRWVKVSGERFSGGLDAPGMGVEFSKINKKSNKALERFVREFIQRMRRPREF